MQSYLRQYDWSIITGGLPGVHGGGIYLGSRLRRGDSMYRDCTIVVNNISIDLTPFRAIRYTYEGEFSRGEDGVDCTGDFEVLSAKKRYIKTIRKAFYGGFSSETVTDVDVSDINQHAFFYAAFSSARKASSSSRQFVLIKRIEFLT